MKTRPWPIVLLALAHVLAPVGNLWINSLLLKMKFFVYLGSFWHSSGYFPLFQFFLAYPLAGAAIYACRKWSFGVFAGAWLLGVFFDVRSWLLVPQVYPLWLFLSSSLVDLALVGYFLHPAVRAPFLNPRLRWWESKPRYRINHWAHLESGEHRDPCLIMDISEGGVFIKATPRKLERGETVKLCFPFFRESFVFSGTVVYSRRHSHPGYGIQFVHTKESEEKVRRIVAALRVFRAKSRDSVPLREDFLNWARGLKSGRGWFPEWTGANPRPSVTQIQPAPAESPSEQKAA